MGKESMECTIHTWESFQNDTNFTTNKLLHMEYSEELIADLLQEWKSKGYTDSIIIDHGLLFASNDNKYFSLRVV